VGRHANASTSTDYEQLLDEKLPTVVHRGITLSVEPGVSHAVQKVYTARPIPGTSSVMAVGFSTSTGSKSWLSNDDGATWTKLNTPGTSNLTTSAFVSVQQKGWAVGYSIVDSEIQPNGQRHVPLRNTACDILRLNLSHQPSCRHFRRQLSGADQKLSVANLSILPQVVVL